MHTKTEHLFLILIVLAAWIGLSLQFTLNMNRLTSEGHSVLHSVILYFGYLTTLTNFFVAIVSTTLLLAPSSKFGKYIAKPTIFGSVAATIFFGGLAYHFLLSGLRNLEGVASLTDIIQHYIVPIGFVLYWFVFPPKQQLSVWTPLSWSMFPVFYLIYVFSIGAIIGVYPYPMVNVSEIGYSQAITNSLMLILSYLVTAYVFFGITKIILKYRTDN